MEPARILDYGRGNGPTFLGTRIFLLSGKINLPDIFGTCSYFWRRKKVFSLENMTDRSSYKGTEPSSQVCNFRADPESDSMAF